MTDHSLDVLTDAHGHWVPVGGILRWRGEHLAPEPPPRRLPRAHPGSKRGTCGCGKPAHSATARYCLDCWLIARQTSWRKSAARRRNEVAA